MKFMRILDEFIKKIYVNFSDADSRVIPIFYPENNVTQKSSTKQGYEIPFFATPDNSIQRLLILPFLQQN